MQVAGQPERAGYFPENRATWLGANLSTSNGPVNHGELARKGCCLRGECEDNNNAAKTLARSRNITSLNNKLYIRGLGLRDGALGGMNSPA